MSKTQTPLGEIDTDYRCEIKPPSPASTLTPIKWTTTLKGQPVEIPSRHLFIAEDGSVYVVVKRRGKVREYASLNSLIDVVKKTQIIEGCSEKL